MGSAEVRHLIEEGQRYEAAGAHDRALARYRSAVEQAVDPALRSEAIRRQADVHRLRSEWADGLRAAREAEEIAAENDLQDLLAEAVNSQGAIFHARGDLDQAALLFRRGFELSTHPRVRGIAMQNLGIIAATGGDVDGAAQCFKEAYEHCKEGAYERGMLFALMNYARAMYDQGKTADAERLLHEAEILAINMMDLNSSHFAALNRAEALVARGAYDEAEVVVSSALGFYGNSGNPQRRLDALRLLGDITRGRGSAQQARLFYKAAHDLATKIEAAKELKLLTERLAETDAEDPATF